MAVTAVVPTFPKEQHVGQDINILQYSSSLEDIKSTCRKTSIISCLYIFAIKNSKKKWFAIFLTDEKMSTIKAAHLDGGRRASRGLHWAKL